MHTIFFEKQQEQLKKEPLHDKILVVSMMIEETCFNETWKLTEKINHQDYYELYKAERIKSNFKDIASIIKIQLEGKKYNEINKKAEYLEKEILKMMRLKSSSNVVSIDDYEIIKKKLKKKININIRCNYIESIDNLENISSKKILEIGLSCLDAIINAKELGTEDILISMNQIYQTKFQEFELITINFNEEKKNNIIEIGKLLYKLFNGNKDKENDNIPKYATEEESKIINLFFLKESLSEEELKIELTKLKSNIEDRLCPLKIDEKEEKEEEQLLFDQTLSILDNKKQEKDESYFDKTLSILDSKQIEEEEEDQYDKTVSIYSSNKKE